jgi:hypothetical protein
VERSSKVKTSKLYIKVEPEFDKKLVWWAKTLGLTKSALGNLIMQSGLERFVKMFAAGDELDDLEVKLFNDVEREQGKGK